MSIVSQSTAEASSALTAPPLLEIASFFVSPAAGKVSEVASASRMTSAALCLTSTTRCMPPALTTTEAARSMPRSLAVALTLRVFPCCSTVSQERSVVKADQLSLLVETVSVCSPPSLVKVTLWAERSRVASSTSLSPLHPGRRKRSAKQPKRYLIWSLIIVVALMWCREGTRGALWECA